MKTIKLVLKYVVKYLEGVKLSIYKYVYDYFANIKRCN